MASANPTPIASAGAGPTPLAAGRSRPWVTMGTGVLVLGVLLLHQIAQPDLATAYDDPLVRLTTLATVLLGAGLVAARRYRLLTNSDWLRFALAFEVLVAFWISLLETAPPLASEFPVRGISAVGPWIVFVSVVLSARPGWILSAGLISASMWPLAYWINIERHGLPMAPWTRLIVWAAINYLIAVLAYLFGRRLSGLVTRSNSTGLGAYQLLTPIGAGGMGEVWKATHQLLARKAAIKLVRPRTAAVSERQAENWVRRFQREANVIAGLQSPNTIYLYDFGVAPDGQFYYAMELLDGISLETLVTSFGPQPPARVRAMLLQVCASLEEAHQQGLVHRDLKPSNIMTCKLALTYDFVKVLDFGLAKCAACEEVSQLSAEGVGMGTPGYISPEVALGEERVDERADIYALGCVAYFLLTGSLVFPEKNPMTMALKHVQEKPVPPSQRTELPIPAEIEAIVMQCLEKKPADRPASVRVVADRLLACSLPDWTPADASAWWERHLPPTSTLRAPMTIDVASTGHSATRTAMPVSMR